MRSLPVIALALALAGCEAFRFQAGLAQAPGINRRWTPEDFAHDVIANGDETCPRSGRAEDDSLFLRWPPCGGALSPPKPPPRRSPPPPPERRPGPRAQEANPWIPLDRAP
jgi:hypothetical protein